MESFYVTTAIDYPSGNPHLGHAYEKIIADFFARWHKLLGKKVFFLTGTDEHGLKIQKKAEQQGKTPKEFVDEMHLKFKELCKKLNISYTRFIRTTEEAHTKAVYALFDKIYKNGDIYKGKYSGYYCVECETYYTEREAPDKKCPFHKIDLEYAEEEAYFFKLSKYQNALLDHINKNPDFIFPESKRNEIINRLKQGLQDLCISRSTFTWGIKLPTDPKHVFYVWVDALTNYLTGIGFPNESYKEFWPADMHNIGIDIVWHHAVIWPALLLSAGIELPKRIVVHGFITLKGEKMSKSKGITIDPFKLAEKYGVDKVRYFFLRTIPFGQDGDFSEEELVKRTNAELADSLGNLLHRVSTMYKKYFDSQVVPTEKDNELFSLIKPEEVVKHVENLELHVALAKIFEFIDACNKYINDKAPWELAKNNNYEELKKVLYNLAEALRMIAQLLYAFIPEAAEKILDQLGYKLRDTFDFKFGNAKSSGVKGPVLLFKKIKEIGG